MPPGQIKEKNGSNPVIARLGGIFRTRGMWILSELGKILQELGKSSQKRQPRLQRQSCAFLSTTFEIGTTFSSFESQSCAFLSATSEIGTTFSSFESQSCAFLSTTSEIGTTEWRSVGSKDCFLVTIGFVWRILYVADAVISEDIHRNESDKKLFAKDICKNQKEAE